LSLATSRERLPPIRLGDSNGVVATAVAGTTVPSQPSVSDPSSGARWALIATLVVAAAIRFITIGQQSYWLDETVTVRILHRSFTGMLAGVAHQESTPPLYYIFAWAWAHLFGYSEGAVRSLSAAAGLATVAIVYLVGRDAAGRRIGLIATALAAVNPFLIWYSQEARAYALLAFFSVLSFYYLVRLCTDGRAERRSLWLWALAASLAICTHYFAIFVVAPEGAWLLWTRRRRTVLPILLIITVCLALLPLIHAQRDTRHTAWISATPLTSRLAQLPEQFVSGLDAPGWRILSLVALFGVLVGAIGLLTHLQELAHGGRLALGVVCAGLIAMLALALVGEDVLLSRNAIELLPSALVPVACGLTYLTNRVRLVEAAAALAIAGTGLIAVIGVDLDQRYQRTDWRGVAHVILKSPTRHLVIVDPWGADTPLLAYTDLQQLRRKQTVRTHEIDVLHFLLSPSGATRRTIPVRVPSAFHRLSTFRAPELEVTRYVVRGTRSVVTPNDANALFVPQNNS
jgi:mannosyltransferase